MVIELSAVQFGLKSYAWFQNQTSAQREFDLKSHFEITQCNSLNTRTTRTTKSCQICQTRAFLSFIFLQHDWLVLKNLEILLVVLFYCLILIGWEKDAIQGKKWYDLGINRTADSQSDCKDNQWFQNGCNKEKNPGPTPVYNDPSMIVVAPSSQSYELIFEQNVGKHCVLMSCIVWFRQKPGSHLKRKKKKHVPFFLCLRLRLFYRCYAYFTSVNQA